MATGNGARAFKNTFGSPNQEQGFAYTEAIECVFKTNPMNKKKSILRYTLQLLSRDVQSFRQIILASEGGELPKEIKEKEKLMHAIERLIKSSPHQTHS
jgi:hypothetical protein